MAKYKGSFIFAYTPLLYCLLKVHSVGTVADLKSITKFDILWYQLKGSVTAVQNPERYIRRYVSEALFKPDDFMQKEMDIFKKIFDGRL